MFSLVFRSNDYNFGKAIIKYVDNFCKHAFIVKGNGIAWYGID